jgi:hypothetical protein
VGGDEELTMVLAISKKAAKTADIILREGQRS